MRALQCVLGEPSSNPAALMRRVNRHPGKIEGCIAPAQQRTGDDHGIGVEHGKDESAVADDEGGVCGQPTIDLLDPEVLRDLSLVETDESGKMVHAVFADLHRHRAHWKRRALTVPPAAFHSLLRGPQALSTRCAFHTGAASLCWLTPLKNAVDRSITTACAFSRSTNFGRKTANPFGSDALR